jgi:GTP-binding protein
MFVDRARFVAQAGRGGDGIISFRREAGTPRGGPDGGDGGDGGAVIVRATRRRPTLADVASRPVFKAEDGVKGKTRNKAGRMGKDVVLEVPVGTIVYAGDGEATIVACDLTVEGQEFVLARGGRGGFGNVHYATATNQVPRVASHGGQGERRTYTLELKLLAQVGLVGLPNAGKSTFLRRVSRARPKVGAYPFTTLRPHLGVASIDTAKQVVIADLPGLIEGAHEGVGLGDEFLRHVERCRVLLHLIDGTGGPEAGTPTPVEAYRIIRGELAAYEEGLVKARTDRSRPAPRLVSKDEVVALNKCDALSKERVEEIAAELEAACGKPVRRISGVAGTGVDAVLQELVRIVDAAEAAAEPLVPAPERVPLHRVYDLTDEEVEGGPEDESGPPPLA